MAASKSGCSWRSSAHSFWAGAVTRVDSYQPSRLKLCPFLANFSLDTLAKRTGHAAIDYSKGGGGGAGGGGSNARTGKARNSLHSTLSCLLTESDDNQFDEVAFLAALQSETRNEIESSGATATIVNEDTNRREFAIDYQSPQLPRSYQCRRQASGKVLLPACRH